jgi:hypothetical protein
MTSSELATLMAQVPNCTPRELSELWRRHFGIAGPDHELIRRYLLAWRLQARVFGGLSVATRRRLKDLDAAFAHDAEHRLEGVAPLKSGTEFVRIWKGHTHRVRVTSEGFAYEGKVYKNLSQIARRITGTRWSGPKFFGTQKTGQSA